MSRDYTPVRPGLEDFNANVHGCGLLGDMHHAFRLPLDPYYFEQVKRYGEGTPNPPFEATAEDTAAWAKALTNALRFVDQDDEYRWYIECWRDFLAACDGYKVIG